MKEKVTYIVKIEISYHRTEFEFGNIEEASNFMEVAVKHNVKGEDRVKVYLMPRFEEEGDEE